MIHDLLKKKLDNIAKELGAKVDYRSCEDEYSTWREITIEYDHDLKESCLLYTSPSPRDS